MNTGILIETDWGTIMLSPWMVWVLAGLIVIGLILIPTALAILKIQGEDEARKLRRKCPCPVGEEAEEGA